MLVLHAGLTRVQEVSTAVEAARVAVVRDAETSAREAAAL
jgi:hypothetical protein